MIATLAAVLATLVAAVPPGLRGKDLEALPTTRKEVVLTFDAGADAKGFPVIHRTLRREGVPATFFLTGRWVERYPGFSRTIGLHYEVGNHTHSHPKLTPLGAAAVTAELRRAEGAIRKATGRDPRPLFRFPYGDRDARTIAIVNRNGYVCVRWTVDTWGWMGRSRQSRDGVVRRVTQGLRPGAIVMFHLGGASDGSTLDADALPAVIAAIRARGYRFTTLERLGGVPKG
jgi:peptidoglycan-N-acetylglucosamine deacetylase